MAVSLSSQLNCRLFPNPVRQLSSVPPNILSTLLHYTLSPRKLTFTRCINQASLLSLSIGFCQWEAMAGNRRAEGKKDLGISLVPPMLSCWLVVAMFFYQSSIAITSHNAPLMAPSLYPFKLRSNNLFWGLGCFIIPCLFSFSKIPFTLSMPSISLCISLLGLALQSTTNCVA